MRAKLERVFTEHFTQGSGATECMLMIFGAYITVRDLAKGDRSERTIAGVNEMLFGFTTGLPLGNPFWQRASVVLFPLVASAQIDLLLAAAYAEEEAKRKPDDPAAAELRRRAVQCMGGFYSVAMMALATDRGLGYVQKHGRAFRDALDNVLEG